MNFTQAVTVILWPLCLSTSLVALLVSRSWLGPQEKTDLKLNVVGKIPEILLDNTDRNRTSPFAFTGNKFELRAAGSASNCAQPRRS